MTNRLTLMTLTLAAVLYGCATSPVDAVFGDAVRATLAEQKAAPQPTTGDEQATLDGPRTEAVLEAYRGAIGNPAAVFGSQGIRRE
jgi:hypothetical protein